MLLLSCQIARTYNKNKINENVCLLDNTKNKRKLKKFFKHQIKDKEKY